MEEEMFDILVEDMEAVREIIVKFAEDRNISQGAALMIFEETVAQLVEFIEKDNEEPPEYTIN